MFNYNHLYYFYMIAKLGGVMKASRALRVAQPSLSAQVKTLEAKLNRALFRKVGRRLVLTTEGERAFGFCRRMFEAGEEFSDYLLHSDTVIQPRIRIGVSPEIERPFVADALTSLLRKKDTETIPLLSMIAGEHGALVEKLRNRELHAVVTHKPAHTPDLSILAQLAMPVVAVATPAFARKHQLLRDLGVAPLMKGSQVGLVLPGEVLRLRVETDLFLQRTKIRNRTVFESDILAGVVCAAIDGAGVALLPLPYVLNELENKRLTIIGSTTGLWKHHVYVLAGKNAKKEPVLQGLQFHFETLAASLNPQKFVRATPRGTRGRVAAK